MGVGSESEFMRLVERALGLGKARHLEAARLGRRILDRSAIVLLQETHGTSAELVQLRPEFLYTTVRSGAPRWMALPLYGAVSSSLCAGRSLRALALALSLRSSAGAFVVWT